MSPHKATISPETLLIGAQLLKQFGDFFRKKPWTPFLNFYVENKIVLSAFVKYFMEFLLSSILYKQCNDAENEMHDFESKFRVPNGWFDSRHNTFDVFKLAFTQN